MADVRPEGEEETGKLNALPDKPLLFQEIEYRQHTDPMWSGRLLVGDYTPSTAMMALPLIKNKKQAYKYRHERYWKELEGPLAELARLVYVISDAELSSIDSENPSTMQIKVISALSRIGSVFCTTPSSRGSALVYLRSKEGLSNKQKLTLLICMGHVKEAHLAAKDPEVHFHIPKFQTAIGVVRYDKPGPYVMEENGLIYIRGDRVDPVDAVIDHGDARGAAPNENESEQVLETGESGGEVVQSLSSLEKLLGGLGASLAYEEDETASGEEADFVCLEPS